MNEAEQDQPTLKLTPLREQRDQSDASPQQARTGASPVPTISQTGAGPVPTMQRQIFREQALQHYIQKNEKSVLPRTISPFVFICCWVVLALSILAGFFIWSIPVPNYVDAPGMPILQGSSASAAQTSSILAFFPLSALAYIHSGQIVQVASPTLATTILTGHITSVDTQHLNATELGERYAINAALVQSLPMSEIFVGTVTTSQAIPLQNGISGQVIIRYQQGTREALSLLLNLSNP